MKLTARRSIALRELGADLSALSTSLPRACFVPTEASDAGRDGPGAGRRGLHGTS